MLRAHYLQHVPFEDIGSIRNWLETAGYEISCTCFFESANMRLPRLEDIDLLIIMGGPMSVNDEDAFPWLIEEKRFIRSAIDSGKRVLGICLGAQLIASAMDASIYPNHTREIGWFPVFAVDSTDKTAFRFPSSVIAFHWHGETFDLPKGSVRLARSNACENQAFQLGSSVIGLQFHLETTLETALALTRNCRDDLQPLKYVQSEREILSVEPGFFQSINNLMAELLTYLHKSRT